MPLAGEKLAFRDLSIEVIDMDGLVIDKLLVQPRSAQGLRAGEVAPSGADAAQRERTD
jgi:hypothetical protein